ncbi:MAG TPA: M28 family peptidase [Vicinamibacterales bacterium]
MKRRALLLLLLCAACARPESRFSLDNARAHVQMLAGTIGCRAIGTPENARARAYLVDQLRLYGYDVRVQETDARRPDLGRTAHVFNIIAVKAGAESAALGLVSHYDSSPDAPGAADDGLGVAVSLETARLLAARGDRRHALFVLITDGEEAGLMGAAGLVTDREVMGRLQAYINIEATGNDSGALLFEAGPANGWIVAPWARRASHPRGTSYGIEIYRRLPNDTDFSILKRHDLPGLNFAAVGDSYAYHTARDTADRLTDRALLETGENVVDTAIALDALDLSARDNAPRTTFFDVGRTFALSWGPGVSWSIAAASLVFGLLAWFRTVGASLRMLGGWRWALEGVWTIVGVALVAAAMVGGTWALRESRAVYHPWYAQPGRLFVLLIVLGTLAGWLASRLGAQLPARAHGPRHPMFVWSVTLPLWVVLAGVMGATAPSAAYLWTLPLLVAGIGLLAIPVGNIHAVRIVSVVVLGVAGTLWLRDCAELLRFLVALLARLPLITPVWLYAAVMLAAGAMVVPPLVAAVAATRPLVRPALGTACLLAAAAIAGGLAHAAPAYTYREPQRRSVRMFVESNASTATVEVASQEPGLDLDAGAPGGWFRATDALQGSVPWPRFALPFVFRTSVPSPGPPPAAAAFTVTPVAAGSEVTVTVVPREPGLSVAFLAPEHVTPARSNLPGIVTGGRWRALYVAIPVDGVTWQASFKAGTEGALPSATAILLSTRLPGGTGWQSLPAWLPQQNAVWHAEAMWALR